MSTHAHPSPAPVGGPLWTPGFRVLAALAAVGVALLAWRFAAGLGAATNLSDGYPWGIWIAFDMVVGTALAAGGYAVALLVYAMNRGRYHPLVRSALVTSALGYTLGALAVIVDLGRYWNVWKIPATFWRWNLESMLLQVALWEMLFVLVLWIEVSPAFLERWKTGTNPGLRAFAGKARPRMEKALPWLLVVGLLLPTMHQSWLGGLMLLSGWKLHPLWSTPLLPLLFLVSALAMGYAAVVMESMLASVAFRRPRDTALLARLGGVAAGALAVFLALRFADLALRGRLPLAVAADRNALLFWAEAALFAGALALLWPRRARMRPGRLFRAAMVIALAGIVYRFATFLIAYQPGAQWSYFPGVQEILVTVGLVSLELMAYVWLVRRYPVLAGAPRPAAAPEPAGPASIPVPKIVSDLAPSRGESP